MLTISDKDSRRDPNVTLSVTILIGDEPISAGRKNSSSVRAATLPVMSQPGTLCSYSFVRRDLHIVNSVRDTLADNPVQCGRYREHTSGWEHREGCCKTL